MAIKTGWTGRYYEDFEVGDLAQNAVNLGWEEVRRPHPVFDGDTLYAAPSAAQLPPFLTGEAGTGS